ncbi:MAG: PIN/TRAM domain-containing protein [Thermosulfidibacteraceae bacterium]
MMKIRILIEFLIVVVGTALAIIYSKYYLDPGWIPLGAIFGFSASLTIVYIIRKIVESSISSLIGVNLGVGGGLVVSWFAFSIVPSEKIDTNVLLFSRIFVMLVFGYFGGLIGLKIAELVGSLQLKGTQQPSRPSGKTSSGYSKVLDTSAIIDGRIADVCETGFLEATIIIPTFVLKELQDLADSHDPFLRAKGRRGFDILKRLKECRHIMVKIVSVDFPDNKDVDGKLIRFAKKMKAPIITTDYNLNQMAQLQGVEVLNINELSKALRPIVIPGEELEVFVMKPGKDPKQGVGHLEDGTMVVVEDGKSYIGKRVRMVVTNLLQTSSGRIIFGRVREVVETGSQEDHYGERLEI